MPIWVETYMGWRSSSRRARAAERWVLLERTDEGCGDEDELQHECEGEGEGADVEGEDGVPRSMMNEWTSPRAQSWSW